MVDTVAFPVTWEISASADKKAWAQCEMKCIDSKKGILLYLFDSNGNRFEWKYRENTLNRIKLHCINFPLEGHCDTAMCLSVRQRKTMHCISNHPIRTHAKMTNILTS